MRNLINFIIRNSTWFVFAFYVLLSCLLLSNRDSYHRSVALTSANAVSSAVYSVSNSVTGYFNLRSINESLMNSNAMLENEVLNLQKQLAETRSLLSDTVARDDKKRYDYVLATVINNSTRHPRNYFTINRGKADGVQPGMGVVDHNGIVGIVNVCGNHTSRIISLLNESQKFSVRISGTPYVGTLQWRGGDPKVAYMSEIPRHARYQVGDTVITSGYSTTFPEGVMVGTIMNRVRTLDDNFFTFKVRLSPDFNMLSTVRVIKDIYKNELDSLANFDIEIK